jgi:saccharopine dehydrogenase-like NADP-dependent oxidoreductase
MAFGRKALNAAIKARVDYQDFAAADDGTIDWVEGIRKMLTETSEEFKAIGKTAVISTGSAPGLICVVARDAMKHLDSCETIYLMVYEGVEAKRFLPFWWSPAVAYQDMSDTAWAFENGQIIPTEPFSRPIYRRFKGVEGEVRLVEHAHDEPVNMGINSKEFFKGARNIYFKYGGVGIEFAEPLYRMGILSDKPIEVDGHMVIPRNLVLKLTPPAPKYYDEIKEILDEGLVSDTGAMVVQAFGKKNGKSVMVESYVYAPGCVESFQKSGLPAETYLTGQGGALYTKMFVNGKIHQKGLISSDMLTEEQVKYYLAEAAKLGITVETTVEPV